jgi:hypothetical protein
MSRKSTSAWFVIIIASAAFINVLNIRWGLPNNSHIYSYNGDELTYLSRLSNLDIKKRDFNPKSYFKPDFPTYYTGMFLYLGGLLNVYEIGNKEYYKSRPEQLARILVWLRLFWGKIPLLLLVLITFLIGSQLVDTRFGLVAGFTAGFLPTIMVNSNYAVENVFIITVMAFVYYTCIIFYKRQELKWLILASFFTGLAMATKQTGVLCFIFIAGVLWLGQKNKLKMIFIYTGTALIVSVLSFTLFSPYYMKFVVMKICCPGRVQPDLHTHSTDLPLNIFRFDIPFLWANVRRILNVNVIELGGPLFWLFPLGVWVKRKEKLFLIMAAYVAVFYIVSIFVRYSSDSRLTPLAYFLALFGAVGCYHAFGKAQSRYVKYGIPILTALYLLFYSGLIVYKFNTADTRKLSSEWLEKNVLTEKNVTIGLHEAPWYGHPDIITREWMHNKEPNSPYYRSRYDEIFMIPDHSLSVYGGEQIIPARPLETLEQRMDWLVNKGPQYIVLMHEAEGAKRLLKGYDRYVLIKKFKRFDLLGLHKLRFLDWDCWIYKRKNGA